MYSDFGSGIDFGIGRLSCTMTSLPTQIDYDSAKMIITLTPTKYFPSDTVFVITIPTYWS